MHLMDQPVIIFGAGGLGKLALEIFESNGIVVYGLLDDDESLAGSQIGQVSVLGSTSDQGFLKLIGKKCQAFIAESDHSIKRKLVTLLNENRKVMPVNAIHGTANLSASSSMGHGNLISTGAVVNAYSHLGSHGIIQANATIDYGVKVKDFVEIGAGAIIGAEVTIGEGVFIGSGATLVSGITIGDHARVGAGSVVISDVQANETVFGNPAEKVDAG